MIRDLNFNCLANRRCDIFDVGFLIAMLGNKSYLYLEQGVIIQYKLPEDTLSVFKTHIKSSR